MRQLSPLPHSNRHTSRLPPRSYTARSVLAPAYYEKIAHKKDCVGIPLKYVHAIMCVCMSCMIVSNCVSVFSDSLKARIPDGLSSCFDNACMTPSHGIVGRHGR